MARPTSAVRIALAAELIDGPGTCRELYTRMGCVWPLAKVRACLDNMVRDGQVWSDQRVRVAGVRRPVPLYERALPDDDDVACVAAATQQGGAGMHDLIACWAGLVPRQAAVASEAAM